MGNEIEKNAKAVPLTPEQIKKQMADELRKAIGENEREIMKLNMGIGTTRQKLEKMIRTR
jgi:sulfite reductase beta subunit-like hemoprotein